MHLDSSERMCIKFSHKINFLVRKRILFNKRIRKNSHNKKVVKIYEDKEIMLINKFQQIILYAEAKNMEDNALCMLNKNYRNICFFDLKRKDIFVNRIDKETSGLIIISKNKISNLQLYKQMIRKKMNKNYIAIVYRSLRPRNGIIKSSIKKGNNNKNIKLAITEYRTINIYSKGKISMIEVKLITGVTHQIRIHMKYKNTGILGDLKYLFARDSQKSFNVFKDTQVPQNHALQAYRLSFIHPVSSQLLSFTIPINPNIQKLINLLNIEN